MVRGWELKEEEGEREKETETETKRHTERKSDIERQRVSRPTALELTMYAKLVLNS